jgi:gliding motility-associated-like protein
MRNRIRRLYVFVGLGMLLLSFESFGQTLSKHNWYFGSTQNSIRFNRVTNAPTLITNKATPFGNGGSAVATDPGNGNLLFYTDGNRIYDAQHVAMATDIIGNTAAKEPAAITPVPKQPGKYFVFTNTADFMTGGSVRVTVVDMNRFGSSTFPSPPFGAVETTVKAKNTLVAGLGNVSEGMIILPHDNGEWYWLITQNVNSSVYNATLIDDNSYSGAIAVPVTSTSASVPVMTVGSFAYHEGLKKLAVAPNDANNNARILDFNEVTGVLTFPATGIIANSAVSTVAEPAFYDVEWSASGQYVYLSRNGDTGINGDVLQYDVLNPSTTIATVFAAPSTLFRSFGLQRGPDSLVYHLYQQTVGGQFFLGRIEAPENAAPTTAYNAAPTGFAGINFGGKGFSAYVPKDTVGLKVDFTVIGTCAKSATTFHPIISPNADSLQWMINDTLVTGWSPKRTYTKAGTYTVKLTAFYRGQTEEIEKPLTIKDFPLTLKLVADTTACRDEFPPKRGHSAPKQFSVPLKVTGGTPASITWSNLETGMTLHPDSAGYYYVVVTDNAGCSGYAGVNVREYGLQSQIFNKWYFGKNAGIDFTPVPAKALSESAMDAPEGCAIACDRNGQQIFYTDGSTVWNKEHTITATNIGGNQRATQSALVITVPGDETLYYIFTTQDMNGTDKLRLSYSLYDIKANAGKGGVVQQGTFMYLKNTERITGTDQYLLVHELQNSTFRAYPISPNGIGNPIYTDIGTQHSSAIPHNVDGYMKLGGRNLVAVPISTPGVSARIEVFKLDSVGMLTLYNNIDLNDNSAQIYGIEFSGSGKKLFASVRYTANSSAIYEYSIDSVTLAPTFVQKIPVPADLGAIQIGPDGQIYVAVNNSGNNTSLGTIQVVERPGDKLAKSSFNLAGFPLAGGTNSWLGLPNFININSNPPQTPGLDLTASCSQQDTKFEGSGRDPNIEEYYFTVTDAAGQTVATSDPQNKFNPEFIVKLPAGKYKVTLRLQNRCDSPLDFAKNFEITGPPIDPTTGVPFCNTTSVNLDANPTNAPGLTYLWKTGETTETLTVTKVGLYSVTVFDDKGCSTEGQFVAADSRPKFDLGPDQSICEKTTVPDLNVRNAGMTYVWTIDGVPAPPTQTQPVNTTVIGSHEYFVRVTDPLTTCFREDTKVYTINVVPAINFTGTNPTSCGAGDGSVSLSVTFNAAGGPLYTYNVTGPGTNQTLVDQNGSAFNANSLIAGTYTALVTDQTSNCSATKTAGLSDANFNLSALPAPPNCDPVDVNVSTNLISTPVTWTATGPQTFTASIITNGAGGFVIPDLPEGDYTIEVGNGTCIQTVDQTIAPAAKIPVILTPDLCALTLTASSTAPGPTTFDWSLTPASAINGTPSGATISIAANTTSSVVFTVVGSNASGCPRTETITLDPGAGILPNLLQSDACKDIVTINAVPTGNFTYYWFVNSNPTPDPTLGGSSIFVDLADDGNSYVVGVYEPQSGCRRDSGPLIAQIKGPVDALLASPPACQDDQPISLTATTTDPTGATYTWKLNGSTLPGVTTPTTAQVAEGDYEVEISKGTCKATAKLTVRRAPLPIVDLPNRLVICDDPENTDPATRAVDLDPGSYIAYDWFKNGVTLNYTDRVLTADTKGEYKVVVTDAFGCKNNDATKVDEDCLPLVNGPNAFIPASLKVNHERPEYHNADFWLFTRFIDDDNFKVFIFNRWGEMIFSSTDRYFRWNGGFNNDISRPLPPGTYSYVVQYVASYRKEDGVKEKRGGVALIR